MTAELFDILYNSLILQQIAPYLPLSAILALSNASKPLQRLLTNAPELWRYVDLSTIKSAKLPFEPIDSGGNNWRSQRMDEALTEDEFYSGPLRGIFSNLHRRGVLKHVHVLVLDGLSVPADLVQEILSEDRFNVRVLSVREVTHLNERKLTQALRYAVRPTRPPEMPRLRALYVFGQVERPKKPLISTSRSSEAARAGGVTASEGAQIGATWNERSHQALHGAVSQSDDNWYQPTGRMMKTTPSKDWADTLNACEGIIAFDAVLCRGPRHDIEISQSEGGNSGWLPPAIANVALGSTGCVKCSSSPEGPGMCKQSPAHHLPLLGPPSNWSASVANLQIPNLTSGLTYPPLYVRCQDCLRGRWCERCNKWWDETCYTVPENGGQQRRQEEVRDVIDSGDVRLRTVDGIKVHWGLCVEDCLVGEMMTGAGSFGMWG